MDLFSHTILKWRAAFSLSLLVLLLLWETLAPFFTYFVGTAAKRGRHGLNNVMLSVLNSTITALVFAALWLMAARWAQAHNFGLLNWFPLPFWPRVAAAFLLFDAWMYWWHRFNHSLPFLWRFHRTHHSDPTMDVTTANRFHVGEIALSSLLRIPVIALLGMQIWELALYELAMFSLVQLQHANIALPSWLDRTLRVFIATPLMHKVHHSRFQPETDSNYSSFFSFWDRLFNTFRLRDDPAALRYGLEELDDVENHTFLGLLATPFKRLRRTSSRHLDQEPLVFTQQSRTASESPAASERV